MTTNFKFENLTNITNFIKSKKTHIFIWLPNVFLIFSLILFLFVCLSYVCIVSYAAQGDFEPTILLPLKCCDCRPAPPGLAIFSNRFSYDNNLIISQN
jgi:hypothetical protein